MGWILGFVDESYGITWVVDFVKVFEGCVSGGLVGVVGSYGCWVSGESWGWWLLRGAMDL